MKKQILVVISWIVSLVFCVVFVGYLQNYQIFRAWYLTRQHIPESTIEALQLPSDQSGSSTESSNTNFVAYYLSLNYKYIDIHKSIEIANTALQKIGGQPRNRREAREQQALHVLLGQLYFYIQEYKFAKAHYWKALLASPNNSTIRYNYELTSKYVNSTNFAESQFQTQGEQLEIPANQENESTISLPLSIERIITNSEFFYYFRESLDAEKARSNAW